MPAAEGRANSLRLATAQTEKYESMAYTLLNHYLDLVDAIEEQNADNVDYSDFDHTDIPKEMPLPEAMYLSVSDSRCSRTCRATTTRM